MIDFLSSTRAKVLTAVLIGQAALFYASPNIEYVPTMKPLEEVSKAIGDWRMTSEYHGDQEKQNLLKADDALTRVFERNNEALTLFVAFFKTQGRRRAPLSARMLARFGRTPASHALIKVPVDGRAEPIEINVSWSRTGKTQASSSTGSSRRTTSWRASFPPGSI